MEYIWECPNSLISADLWETVDYFWLCNTRVPGFSGWALQRMSYPAEGPVYDQDNWTLWAFQVIENAFYELQNDQQEERGRARDLEQMHRQVQAEGRK